MIIRKSLALVGAATIAMVGYSAPASAQATRTWVSGVGDDVNPCSRTAPCKTFAGAISKTATGGEIDVLDPGGFGTINITKHMVIDGRPFMSSLLAANVNGVLINGAGITVTLRNLTINGACQAPNNINGNGIRIIQAGTVNIDNLVIENFSGTIPQGRGVAIETATANVKVRIANTDIFNVNGIGIHSNPSAGSVILVVDNTKITGGNLSGIQLRQLTTATIHNSSMTESATGAGLTLELTSATAHVSNSLLANNAFGIFNGSGGTPTTRIFNSVITGNTTAGLNIPSGSVISYGNNAIRGNAGNEAPTGAATGTQ